MRIYYEKRKCFVVHIVFSHNELYSVLVSGSSDQVFRSVCLMINIKIKTVNAHEGILVLIVMEFSSK